jgi:hypothetical protein
VIFEQDNEDEESGKSNEDDSENSSQDSSDDDYVEIDKEEEATGPLPDPPLFSYKPPKPGKKTLGAIIDISRENWDEGTDTK